jgi:hypothetical protein
MSIQSRSSSMPAMALLIDEGVAQNIPHNRAIVYRQSNQGVNQSTTAFLWLPTGDVRTVVLRLQW